VTARLESINADQRQNSLRDSGDLDEDYEQLELLGQSTIIGKLVHRWPCEPRRAGQDTHAQFF
jgi:hypothetical protein